MSECPDNFLHSHSTIYKIAFIRSLVNVMKNYIALFASFLAVISVVPYLIDIVKRKTKPNIVSWITWSLLTGIATAATFSAGEYRTALLTLGSTICSLTVVALGFKYGFAKFSKFDMFCQIGALSGLFLWLAFDSPVLAVITTVGIDFIGMLPTLRHSYLEPAEETWQTFMIGTLAALLTVISLSEISLLSALFPIYLVLANASIVITVVFRRKQKGIGLSRHSVHETLHE